MDKEKLIKYHFWILLGLAVLLMPVVMDSVLRGVAGATEKEKKDIDSKISALKSAQPKGMDYLTKLDDAKSKLEIDKDRVWKEAYQAQAGLIHWPAALARLDRSLKYGDHIDVSDISTFKNPSVYEAEYRDMAESIKPTEFSKGWKDTLRVIRWPEKNPTSEEVWLALEDMCVQRELLHCIVEVNNLLAHFEEQTGPDVGKELAAYFKAAKQPDLDTQKETVQRFASPYWQLDVATSKAGVGGGQISCRGRLKNVANHRLNVGRIDFHVWLTDPPEKGGRPLVLPIEADYVYAERAVGEGAEEPQDVFFKRTLSAGAGEPKLLAVRQVLTAKYVPVKRVERIELGYQSHRTADQPLQVGLISDKAKKAAGEAAAPPPDPAASGGAPAAAAAPVGDKTPSGVLDRQRYISVSEQVRRMPIGLVLIVDQSHVQDVLRAFANSRLRFQTTQYHLKRLHGNLPPVGDAAGAGAHAEESASNLVEMGLYGLISIYDKYEPKPAEGTPAPAGDAKN